MATISELMEGKKPGEIKVRNLYGDIFIPYFKSDVLWHGLNGYIGKATNFLDSRTSWQIYTEPKPKVKRAQYLVEVDYSVPLITPQFYENDAEAMDAHFVPDGSECRVTRLTETEREFEE